MNSQKGFTIIEIIIVVVIIGILSNLALITFGSQTKEAEEALVHANLLVIQNALELYAIDNKGKYPEGNLETDDEHPLRVLLQDPLDSDKRYYLKICEKELDKYNYKSIDNENDYIISIEYN